MAFLAVVRVRQTTLCPCCCSVFVSSVPTNPQPPVMAMVWVFIIYLGFVFVHSVMFYGCLVNVCLVEVFFETDFLWVSD